LGICHRTQEQHWEETLHLERDFHAGAIIAGRRDEIACSGRIRTDRCRPVS
jgi:hypothetical protein